MNRRRINLFKRIAGIITVLVIVSTNMPVLEIAGR